jgi:hypothetical protein
MKITKRQLRRIIREAVLREWQQGMDPDPSGQETRDQVGEYQSTFNPDNYGWNDEGWDAAKAAGPKGLAKWLVSNPGMYDHLFLGGIWRGMANYFSFDPKVVHAEVLKLDSSAFDSGV